MTLTILDIFTFTFNIDVVIYKRRKDNKQPLPQQSKRKEVEETMK